jgi:hypothetical protein
MAVFTHTFTAVAVSALQDLFSIVAPSTGIVVLHRCTISQTSDYKDAEDEGLLVVIERGAATAGSGGSAVTAAAKGPDPFVPTWTATVRTNDTTRAVVGGGSIQQLHAEVWQVRDTFDYLPLPENRIIVAPSQRLVVALTAAPADALTVNGTIVFEQLGG